MSENEKEERGFKVTDRRINPDEEASEKQTEEKPEKQAEKTPDAGTERKAPPKPPPTTEKTLPPMDFAQFILSLATSAMLYLGDAKLPEGAEQPVDLHSAKQTIDILAMLEEKTRGNLSEQEESLLKNILSDLRIRFVGKSNSTG